MTEYIRKQIYLGENIRIYSNIRIFGIHWCWRSTSRGIFFSLKKSIFLPRVPGGGTVSLQKTFPQPLHYYFLQTQLGSELPEYSAKEPKDKFIVDVPIELLRKVLGKY